MEAEKVHQEKNDRTPQLVRGGTAQFVDNRPLSFALPLFGIPIQCADKEEELQMETDQTVQKKPNNTGLPDTLKNGIENLSGFSMDNVHVHYNSSRPATVQAFAYTQGTDIHIAPGQERHLPHEAWHVIQQMAGRVQPTTKIGGMFVNDNAGLEYEADVMSNKALSIDNLQIRQRKDNKRNPSGNGVVQRVIIPLIPSKEKIKKMGLKGKEHELIILDNIIELQKGNRGTLIDPLNRSRPLQGLAGENIYISGHGCETDIADYTPDNIFRILGNLGLDYNYSGTIVLVACNTAQVGIILRQLLARGGFKANVWGGMGAIRVMEGRIWDCKDNKAYKAAIDEIEDAYNDAVSRDPTFTCNYIQIFKRLLHMYHIEIPL